MPVDPCGRDQFVFVKEIKRRRRSNHPKEMMGNSQAKGPQEDGALESRGAIAPFGHQKVALGNRSLTEGVSWFLCERQHQ